MCPGPILFLIVGAQPGRLEGWSPSGRMVAFAGKDGTIYAMNADGSTLTLLSPPGVDSDTPSWPPGARSARASRSNP